MLFNLVTLFTIVLGVSIEALGVSEKQMLQLLVSDRYETATEIAEHVITGSKMSNALVVFPDGKISSLQLSHFLKSHEFDFDAADLLAKDPTELTDEEYIRLLARTDVISDEEYKWHRGAKVLPRRKISTSKISPLLKEAQKHLGDKKAETLSNEQYMALLATENFITDKEPVGQRSLIILPNRQLQPDEVRLFLQSIGVSFKIHRHQHALIPTDDETYIKALGSSQYMLKSSYDASDDVPGSVKILLDRPVDATAFSKVIKRVMKKLKQNVFNADVTMEF